MILQVHAIGLIEDSLTPYVIFNGELMPITHEFDSYQLAYGDRPTNAEIAQFLSSLFAPE